MAKTQKKEVEIDVIELKRGSSELWLVGDAPFFCNRMAAKAKRELLLPRGRLSATQRATKLKHAPFAEYRDSPYLRRGTGETKFLMVGSAPKKAIAGAALRMPTSVSKTEISQLVSVPQEYVPVWGIPRLDLSVVRMAGISRTPDIRTRARLDRWAMRFDVQWIEPMLSINKVYQLAVAAGIVCGLGDWRIEKGGPNGSFRLVEPDDKELRDIIDGGGYLAQEQALQNPECANSESQELLDWYLSEMERRGLNPDEQQIEDVEVEDVEQVGPFGAGDEQIYAPTSSVGSLPLQNGEEH